MHRKQSVTAWPKQSPIHFKLMYFIVGLVGRVGGFITLRPGPLILIGGAGRWSLGASRKRAELP